MKSQGSYKIECNCTATITVTIYDDKNIVANVCYTHQHQLEHLRLSKVKREEIAAKIKQGVIRDRILDDVRESVTAEFQRHHLIERKDLHNIQHAFGLNEVQRHPNDQQSVLAWIQEWKDSTDFENPLLYYKLQGEVAEEGYDLAKEDFFLVIQAPIQKRMFTKFAPNGVCIDSTHRTNAYDFMLTTVMVIDEFGEGFPGAWCLSYHEDFTTMCIFFNEIKKNCGTTQPFSDDRYGTTILQCLGWSDGKCSSCQVFVHLACGQGLERRA
ncbi:hypothetical protein QZH41_012420 [Actinostola sp. cb2023]|nr:hypothetical protein QZH41_012420 [Actinostola sp. cb2023]